MSSKYSYTKDVNGFDIGQLTYEIEQDTTIITTLEYINFAQSDLDIYFESVLSGDEQTTLGTIVTNSPNVNMPMPTSDVDPGFITGAINGLRCGNNNTNPGYQIDIQPGVCRDSTDISNIQLSGTLTVDITASGANGLDTGSEASSKWYAIHLIGDTSRTNSTAGLFSLSATFPTLPNGYNVFRRIGWVRNNVSSNFINFFMTGNGQTRKTWHASALASLQVLSGGNAVTFTSVDASSLIPSTSELGVFTCSFTVSVSGQPHHILTLRPNGIAIASSPWTVGHGMKNAQQSYSKIHMPLSGSQFFDYRVTSTDNSADIYVCGYEDEL